MATTSNHVSPPSRCPTSSAHRRSWTHRPPRPPRSDRARCTSSRFGLRLSGSTARSRVTASNRLAFGHRHGPQLLQRIPDLGRVAHYDHRASDRAHDVFMAPSLHLSGSAERTRDPEFRVKSLLSTSRCETPSAHPDLRRVAHRDHRSLPGRDVHALAAASTCRARRHEAGSQ